MLKDEKLNLDLYQNLNSNQAPEDFHHVAFKTMNYEAMIIFYSKLFGCEPLYKSEELTFLAFDEEHHRVAIANTSSVFQNLGFIPKTIMRIKNWMNRTLPSIVGLDHISYKLNPIEKWFEFYHKAKEKGLEPYWTINHGWITGMYYKDPDGNLVEIFLNIGEIKKSLKQISLQIFLMNQLAPIWISTCFTKCIKKERPFEELIQKGNTVPEGKKPIAGMEAVMNMRKKYK